MFPDLLRQLPRSAKPEMSSPLTNKATVIELELKKLTASEDKEIIMVCRFEANFPNFRSQGAVGSKASEIADMSAACDLMSISRDTRQREVKWSEA